MSDSEHPPLGSIGWHDLTVDDAESVRDFYKAVAGWTAEGIDMGDYHDYVMKDASGAPVGGVCHARGDNAGLPAQWLSYVTVADLQASLDAAVAQGGSVVAGPRDMGAYGTLGIVRDPAGAVLALMQPAAEA